MGQLWNKEPTKAPSLPTRSPTTHEALENFYKGELEAFTLVWLDSSNSTTACNGKLYEQLRARISCVRLFNHLETCRLFIEAQPTDQCLVLLLSGAYGEQLVPQIHDLDQVYSIYIFCRNVTYHSVWAKNHSKVQTQSR